MKELTIEEKAFCWDLLKNSIENIILNIDLNFEQREIAKGTSKMLEVTENTVLKERK